MLEDLGLSGLVTGFILTWDNIINMFFQPWVGARSDQTRSRFGRRKPWLMLGAPLAVMGAFWALVNINSLPMVYDLGGPAYIGAFTGLYYFASSAAAITGPILAGGLKDLAGYGVLWPFGAVFMVLSIVCMLQVRPKQAAQPAAALGG